MAAKNINISDLSFDGIKTSLKGYLKTQEVFKDYDFEGSAIATIIDLLAYNTFYYGYYSNMIANEMFLDTAKLESSMISLTKPLGYLVSKYNSSRSSIKLNRVGLSVGNLSPFSVFKGFSVAGIPYFFYTLKSVRIKNNNGVGETDYFDVFEAKSFTRRQLVTINLDNQSFVLQDDNIDPKTIIVEVQKSEGEEYVEWINYLLNPDSVVGPNTEIFFIERIKTGYRVNFGKQTSSDISSSNTGKLIEQGNKVYISYLVSSGEDANGVSNFEYVRDGANLPINVTNATISTLSPSRFGRSKPNLEEIRFFAPKSFAKQNRLVTKNDYYAILNELGYGSTDDPDFSYKVFGGEEATPPVYGRVFVSLLDLNLEDAVDFTKKEQINQILSVLKNKSVVSILPEYIPPVEYQIKLTVIGTLPDVTDEDKILAQQSIRSALFSNYSTRRYNQNIIEDDIIEICRATIDGIQLSTGGIFVTVIATAPASINQRKINFKNSIDSIVITDDVAKVTVKNDDKYLYVYEGNTKKGIPIGELSKREGIVTIYANKLPNAITINATPTNDIFYAKDELICRITSSSNITVNIN